VSKANKGEIWIVDLGMAAKVRPCLLITDFPADDELALITVIPHTTAVRGNRWELAIPKPFLQGGCIPLATNPVGHGSPIREKAGDVDGGRVAV